MGFGTMSSLDYSNTSTEKLTPIQILLLGGWFGIGVGLAEVLLQGIRKFALNRMIGFGHDIVWMAPLADIFFFILLGLILVGVSWLLPKIAIFWNILIPYGVLAYFILLLHLPILWYASFVLAVGLSIGTVRLIRRFRVNWFKLFRQSTYTMLGLVVVLTIIVYSYLWISENRSIKSLPAINSQAPNVLFIVLDTVRAQNLGIYGYERSTTPEIEKIFSKGNVYEQAIAPAPWTLPSHASMFTGRWPHELSTDWSQPLDDTYPTLAETLRDYGYMTAAFVANTYYTNRETGLDRGFIRYEDYPISAEQTFISSILGQNLACWRQMGFGCGLLHRLGLYELPARKNAEQVNQEFLDWVGQQGERPFFVFLNYFDAHAPYLPPPPFDVKFGPGRVNGEQVFVEGNEPWGGTSEQLQTEINQYDAGIAYIDTQLGQLVDELKSRSLLENTILVITSDHGEEFREHGVMSHANSLYRPGVRVPLLILTPQSPDTLQRIPEPFSLRNMPLTVLGMVDQEIEIPSTRKSISDLWMSRQTQSFAGPDLQLAELSERGTLPDWYPISKGGMSSIVCNGMRYILNGDGSEEIYDFIVDPLELENLIQTSKGQSTAKNCRIILDSIYSK